MTDENTNRKNESNRGRRLRLVALLVAATLVGGGLLRVGALAPGPAPGGGTGELVRLFHAKGAGPVSFRGELDRTTVMPSGASSSHSIPWQL